MRTSDRQSVRRRAAATNSRGRDGLSIHRRVCGSGFTYREMSVAELLKKCGKPTSKTVVIEDVRSPGAKGKGSIVRGQTAVETWRYERGRQASAMLVKIVDGKIQSISAAP